MIHRAPINSNVVLTWSAGLSSISRRPNTADLIARFSERRIKDSAFEQHTAIRYRRSAIGAGISQCRNNNVWLLSATAEINVHEIDWARSYVPPPSPLPIFYSCVAAFTKEPTGAWWIRGPARRPAKSNYHINTDASSSHYSFMPRAPG